MIFTSANQCHSRLQYTSGIGWRHRESVNSLDLPHKSYWLVLRLLSPLRSLIAGSRGWTSWRSDYWLLWWWCQSWLCRWYAPSGFKTISSLWDQDCYGIDWCAFPFPKSLEWTTALGKKLLSCRNWLGIWGKEAGFWGDRKEESTYLVNFYFWVEIPQFIFINLGAKQDKGPKQSIETAINIHSHFSFLTSIFPTHLYSGYLCIE